MILISEDLPDSQEKQEKNNHNDKQVKSRIFWTTDILVDLHIGNISHYDQYDKSNYSFNYHLYKFLYTKVQSFYRNFCDYSHDLVSDSTKWVTIFEIKIEFQLFWNKIFLNDTPN